MRNNLANYRMVQIALVFLCLLLLLQWMGVLSNWLKQEQQTVLLGQESRYLNEPCRVIESKKGLSYLWVARTDGTRLYVTLPYEDATWYPAGSMIELYGKATIPEGRRNPGGFDQAKWLASKKVAVVVNAERITLLQMPKGVWSIPYGIYQWMEPILEDQLSSEQANLAMALLTGAKHRLSDQFYGMTQRMGIAHIFAVSGLHVGIVGTVLLFFFRKLGWMGSWLSFSLLAVGLLFYTMLAGIPPSAVRASSMLLCASLAMKLYRPVNGSNFLAFSAVLILLENPFLLWSAGFQLSFGVTLALLVFVKPIQRSLHWIRIPWLQSSLAVVLAAWLGSLPISAWHFYTVSFLSPLFNVVLVPLVSISVPLLLIALLCSIVLPWGASIWFFPAQCSLWLLHQGTVFFYEQAVYLIGRVQWNIGQPPAITILAYGILLLLIWMLLCTPQIALKRYLTLVTGILSVGIILSCMPKAPAENQLLYLDVGQGSCAMLYTKAGEVILFDTGAKKQEVSSVLAWYGINQVDAVVLSHTDTDHITGLPQVLETVWVKRILLPQTLLQDEINCNATCVAIAQKALIKLAELQIILEVFSEDTNNSNATELTAVVQGKRDVVAFPGDLALSGVKQFVAKQNRITIWTVPHHGSKASASTQLYRTLKEKGVVYAVISAGIENRYGHPHSNVLLWLEKEEILWFNTANTGAMLFEVQ